jgi:hypothetical protein
MIINEYRRRAADCLCIADDIYDPQNKMLVIAIAQAWLKLAQKAEEADQRPGLEARRPAA